MSFVPTPSVPVTAYFEKGAEAADRSEHAGDQRAFGSGLDAFNEFIASVD